MSSGSKSIGSLETYEPPDKSFSKHVFKDGVGDTTPNEGSTCTVHLALIGKAENKTKKILLLVIPATKLDK